MQEVWDLYDEHRRKLGKTCRRDIDKLQKGEYHLVVTAIILNSRNEILLSKRAKHKKFPLMWECTGGSVIAGETSLQGILREIREELGIIFTPKEAMYLKAIKRDKNTLNIKDLWVFRKDIDIKGLTFPDKEAIEAKWVTLEEFMQMKQKEEIVPTIDIDIEEYQEAIRLKPREAYNYIGKQVSKCENR